MIAALEFEFTTAPAVLTTFGLLALGMALLPRMLHQRPLSFPLLYVLAGVALFSLPVALPDVDPIDSGKAALHLTEAGVIVALFGVGLKIRRPLTLRNWAPTWRLLGIAMPLTVGAMAGLGAWLLGFDVASAVLFGAVLAPTDPVLAADVQQLSPHDEGPGDVRFALTSEAGLNDGLAFPFVMAASAIFVSGATPSNWLGSWLAVDVGYRLAVGVACGWLFGRLLRIVVFSAPLRDSRLAETGEGLIAVAGTFLTYGVTELVEGYGFLAVFIAAQVLRIHERDHEYHEVIHDFSEQIERLVNAVILVLFGAAISDGLLEPVTPRMVVVVLLLVFVVRPLSSIIALGGTSHGRGIISFFGIRGVGSFFYLAYALSKHEFAEARELWAVIGLAVIVSIAVHGLSAGPAMHWWDDRRERRNYVGKPEGADGAGPDDADDVGTDEVVPAGE